jgi:putative DNA primase/helicase
MLMAGAGDWSLPTVAGIITAPTLRPDGTLLSQPGYDPQTRLYLVEDPALQLPTIPEAPTRDEARAALDLILELLAEFPFVGPEDRSVALSGILTAVLRPALMASPLHAIPASTPGSGKSYLVDTTSAIAIGRRCPVIAAGRTEEETEKRLGAMLLSGVPIVSIDNVNGELGGDALCQITERPVVRVRVLGKSETVEIESRATVFATGNGLVLVADMTRRTLLCRLDAGVERPEIRQFRHKPVEMVLQDRGRYLAAALTILRAYQVAGRPGQLPRLASYEQWSDAVRSCLVWLGEADPVATMETAREGDPEAQAIRQLHAHWRKILVPSVGYTSVQIIAQANILAGPMEEDTYLHEDFRDLLVRQAGEGRTISTKRLGKWLAKVCGRVFDGMRLEMQPNPSSGNKYSLRRVDGALQAPGPAAQAGADAYRRASQGV